MRATALSALLAACLAAGCLALHDPLNLEGSFLRHQRAFSADLRWGEWEAAAEHVEPARRAEFDALARALADFRATDYEVRGVQLDEERTSAIVVVVFQGYEASNPVERQLVVTQHWRFDDGSNRWYVTPDADLAGKLEGAGFHMAPVGTR